MSEIINAIVSGFMRFCSFGTKNTKAKDQDTQIRSIHQRFWEGNKEQKKDS